MLQKPPTILTSEDSLTPIFSLRTFLIDVIHRHTIGVLGREAMCSEINHNGFDFIVTFTTIASVQEYATWGIFVLYFGRRAY